MFYSNQQCKSILTVSVVVLLSTFLGAVSVRAAVVEMGRQELIQRSELIFVGKAVSKDARWNLNHTMIVTDYRFAVEEVLLGDPRPEVELTFAGGQLPEEGQAVSDVPSFDIGDVVLLMIEKSETPLLSPVTGMYQGKFQALDMAGYADAMAHDGQGRALEDRNGNLMTFRDFVAKVKEEIPVALTTALPDRSVPDHLQQFVLRDLPAQRYDSASASSLLSEFNHPATDPNAGSLRPEQPAGNKQSGGPEDPLPKQTGSILNKWLYEHRAKFSPIVFNPLPSGGLIGDHDQYQMSYWNRYADIFRVTPSTGTWAWQNDRYDIAGFVDNATMIAQFGQGWGATTLAVAWIRWDGTGFSIESDIAMNPAFSWTVDDYATYYNTNLYNADRTLLHEIGHSWGLQHQFNALSVMNYAPHKYRAYTVLYLDDVAAVRAAFPSDAISQTDIGVSLFYSSGYQDYDDSDLSTQTVAPGASLTVSNVIIENSGTQTVSPSVDWYLVSNVNSWAGSRYVGTTTHSSLSPSTYFQISRTLTISESTPAGTYYLGAFISMGSDNVSDNNASWLDRSIQVTGGCADDAFESVGSGGTDDNCYGASLSPPASQTHKHCDEDWIYFASAEGATYRIETSSLLGGADTTLALHISCGPEVAFDDDGGAESLASRIDWTSTSGEIVDVRIREFSDSYVDGEGYNISVTCLANCDGSSIFYDGFESGTTAGWSSSSP